jgi:pimeloyl-ACP methyl ester carboxylesterase
MSRRSADSSAPARDRLPYRWLVACLAALGAVSAIVAPPAAASALHWKPCGARHVACATLDVPAHYDEPYGKRLHIAVARSRATDPKHRIGTLVFNLGGPGDVAVEPLVAAGSRFAPELNRNFDIIAMDPRGVGRSRPAIACHINPVTRGLFATPFPAPESVNADALLARARSYAQRCARGSEDILPYASTGNVARDIDRLRSVLHERQISYYGVSYGGTLGATFVSMFPRRVRAMVLDSSADAKSYIDDPVRTRFKSTGAAERTLEQFFAACAADQSACSGFGGSNPRSAFSALIARASASPIPATGYASDPRPVTGDDLRMAAFSAAYSKGAWGQFARALAMSQAGDGSRIRKLVDEGFYARNPDGSFAGIINNVFALAAAEQQYKRRDGGYYLQQGKRCAERFPFLGFFCGYPELAYAVFPIQARDVFRGPFRVPRGAATPLVVATTHDSSSPYEEGVRLARRLGNARLLTLDGAVHGAYPHQSRCIDRYVEAHLIRRALPPSGTRCRQDVQFARAPEPLSTNAR